MRIAANSVVSVDYVLKNDAGEVIDRSEQGEPLTYLHGHGQIVTGLETALEGKGSGDRVEIVVQPKDAYGERTTDKTIRVDRKQFPEEADLEVGEPVLAAGPDGDEVTLWIVDVDDENVALCVDHPLAGETLHFDVTVREVRAATKDELEHGHVHGPGDHHHHH